MTSTRSTVGGSGVLDVGVAAVAGLAGGVATSYLQAALPEILSPLTNSAGPWCAVAFVVAMRARGAGAAIACGVVALLMLNIGYGVGSGLRGYVYSVSTTLFWSAAAVVVGPLLGLSAHWIRRARPAWAAAGVGFVAGTLLGEGVYGFTTISDTTPAAYWLAESGLGVAVLVACAATRLRRIGPIVLAFGVALVVGAALFLAYRLV